MKLEVNYSEQLTLINGLKKEQAQLESFLSMDDVEDKYTKLATAELEQVNRLIETIKTKQNEK